MSTYCWFLICNFTFMVIAECEVVEPDTTPNIPEAQVTIFAGAERIIVREPAFGDTVNNSLTFIWVQTGQRNVFLAVFDTTISVKDNKIVNIAKNKWAWNTSLGTGREGLVKFTEGRDVINGVIQTERAPTPLTSGKRYYWAIWAWDDRATKITHSTGMWNFVFK